jgi:bifunctional ADP-heptose synthase (sugar kinase/adenylyltransferase)
MDTRNKIVSGESALEIACRVKQQGKTLTVVTGYFDVLQAVHARALADVRKGTSDGVLMVVLLPRHESLLSPRARAELVAGLGMVDYVVSEMEDSEAFLSRLPAGEVISRQAADEEQTRLLIEHVLVRHS